MKFIRAVLGMSPDHPEYESIQELAKTIEVLLAASNDPLRKAIVAVLDYQDGDPQEYAVLLAKMIALLPPEERT